MIDRKVGNGVGRLVIKTDKLDLIKSSICGKFVTKIGILGQKGAEEHPGSEETNAEIGLKHEKGVVGEKIPQRSFLQMPLMMNEEKIFQKSKIIEDWMARVEKQEMAPEKMWYLAHKDLGFLAERVVQKAFSASGPGWAPNSKATIAMKGSDKPLIDTSELRRSVISEVKGN